MTAEHTRSQRDSKPRSQETDGRRPQAVGRTVILSRICGM